MSEILAEGEIDLMKLQEYRSRGYDTFRMIHTVLQQSGIKAEQMREND